MTHARRLLTVLMSGALLCAAAPARAVMQEYQTLELVRTYASEAEVRAVYPELFTKPVIKDEGDVINFYDPLTNTMVKQLKKELPKVVREEKRGEQNIIIERSSGYQIAPDQSSMLYTEYEEPYIKETHEGLWEDGATPQKNLLYTHQGHVVTELSPNLNTVVVSPNQNYFVAASCGEGWCDALEFYEINGHLLKKEEINASIGITFSTNSEYVVIQNIDSSKAFGEITLFTKTGDFIRRYDYGAQLRDYLFAAHVSDHVEWLLFSMFKSAYLVAGDGQILWQKPYLRIIDCRFYPEKNQLILYSMIDNSPLNESRKAISIVSLHFSRIFSSVI